MVADAAPRRRHLHHRLALPGGEARALPAWYDRGAAMSFPPLPALFHSPDRARHHRHGHPVAGGLPLRPQRQFAAPHRARLGPDAAGRQLHPRARRRPGEARPATPTTSSSPTTPASWTSRRCWPRCRFSSASSPRRVSSRFRFWAPTCKRAGHLPVDRSNARTSLKSMTRRRAHHRRARHLRAAVSRRRPLRRGPARLQGRRRLHRHQSRRARSSPSRWSACASCCPWARSTSAAAASPCAIGDPIPTKASRPRTASDLTQRLYREITALLHREPRP